jgi:hypothetical protein
MNEPKKRGRPTNAEREARLLQVPRMNGDTSREPEDVRPVVELPVLEMPPKVDESLDRAQAYAMRVWSGQASDLKRAERIARVKRALEGQNLPTEGVKYPGSEDDEEWSEDDMKPVTWRKDRQ